MMVRNVVVLPAPLRPTRQTSSPAATDRLTPLRIWLPSMSTFRFDKPSIATLSKFGSNSHHRGNHGWIGKECTGRHVAEKRACLQGDDAMRVALDEVHVVFDLHNGPHARRLGGRDENLHDRVLVARRHTAGRLIEEDDGRIERKGAGDIEQFL